MDSTPPDLGSARLAETTLVPALAYARACVGLVQQRQLACPTPCESWDVGQVLEHMVQSLGSIRSALVHGALPAVGNGPSLGREATHLKAHLETVAMSLVAAASRWRSARPPTVEGLPVSRYHLIHVAAIEAAVHGWDVAAGLGASAPFDEELASLLMRHLPEIVNDETREASFGSPTRLGDTASSSRRLLAALGRDPDWTAGRGQQRSP